MGPKRGTRGAGNKSSPAKLDHNSSSDATTGGKSGNVGDRANDQVIEEATPSKKRRTAESKNSNSTDVSPTKIDAPKDITTSVNQTKEETPNQFISESAPTSAGVSMTAAAEAKADDDTHTHAHTHTDMNVITEGSNTIKEERKKCPYLDTVNRQLIDMDMQKVCSVTLSNLNVYACLVCGKFFQGRGKSTPAYTHSVQCGHFVFINLHDTRAFCLPDGYEIIDSSLDDVKRCLAPRFNPQEITKLNGNSALARDAHGVNYLPGFVGLNNLQHTDYVNVVLHSLSHVTPVRDFFLQPANYESTTRSSLVLKFGEAIRKLWSPHNFKSTVSPQDLLHEIAVCSKKKFDVGHQADCVEFLAWLLNELHRGLGGSHKKPSIISKTLGGLVEVTTLKKGSIAGGKKSNEEDVEEDDGNAMDTEPTASASFSSCGGDGFVETKNTMPFMYLSLDIPPQPLFRDSEGGLIIPQIPLFEVLKKFDGQTWTDQISVDSHVRKQYKLRKLPEYLIFYFVRFSKSNFSSIEKNRSVVTFPVKNLSPKDYFFPLNNDNNEGGGDMHTKLPAEEEVPSLSIHDMKQVVQRYGSSVQVKEAASMCEKDALVTLTKDVCRTAAAVKSQLAMVKYDLVANIVHDATNSHDMSVSVGSGSVTTSVTATKPQQPTASGTGLGNTDNSGKGLKGSYRCHTQNKATGQWFELQDLHVSETVPQLIGLSESYILVYERKK